MDPVNRHVLMIEVDGTPAEVAGRLEHLLPDARVWGEVDPVQAALLVIDAELDAA